MSPRKICPHIQSVKFLVLAASVVACALPISEASARDREVSVSGSCLRAVVPDRGAVTLTVQQLEADPKRAADQAKKIYERVRDAIKRLDLEDADISTSEYSVEDVREWEKEKMVHRGYRARMGLKVETAAIARLGEVIAIASRESLKDVGRLTTFISPKKLRAEQNECLEEAAQQARLRAQKLVAALGAGLGDVVSIQEGGAPSYPSPMPMMAMAKSMRESDSSADAGPGIEVGRQDLSLSVSVTFSIR